MHIYIYISCSHVIIYVCLDKHYLWNTCLWEARRCAMWPRDPARGAFLRRSGAFPPFPLRESHRILPVSTWFTWSFTVFYGIYQDLMCFNDIWYGFLCRILDLNWICSWNIVRFIGFQLVFDQILWDLNGIIGFTIKHIPRTLKHHCWILYVD